MSESLKKRCTPCKLPDALDLPPETVKEAITATTRQIAAEADARWRASFKPAAYLLGTSNRPSQIWMFGVTGGAERWLKIPLDTSQSPVTYAEQALAVVRETPTVQFFGLTKGFIVNYTADHAVRFDLEGRPMETLPALIDRERLRFISAATQSLLPLLDASSAWPGKPDCLEHAGKLFQL